CDGGFYRTPTSVVNLAAISDDANDTSAGTGAQEITLEYLDVDFNVQTATIEMNGLTETTETVTGVMRLYRAYVSRSGTYATQSSGSQKGSITIKVESAGETWAVIPEVGTSGLAVGQSLIGAYTVPANCDAYVLTTVLTVDSAKTADLHFFQRKDVDDVVAPYTGCMRVQHIYTGLSTPLVAGNRSYEKYPEKTDIGYLAKAAAPANVSVEFTILLIER
ncbi:MAG: hypothetical protein KAR20_26210, partial [Candidatus Heimdallarchaeota archaeon]|nr:hypothetical protein [Candidatus Heimdallarchaeota archaeon]